MIRFGIDHSSRPPATGLLKEKGVKFVCRYLSTPDNPKNITRAEADLLKLAKIDVVLVFETTANRALGGVLSGKVDAESARAQAGLVGLPGAPIYFAVDFAARTDQQEWIDEYLNGCASVIGRAKVGVYGGYYVVKRALDARVCRYAWQTYAWSGGQWDKRAHIRQYKNGVPFAGIECDFDDARARDYGQSPAPLIRRLREASFRRQLKKTLAVAKFGYKNRKAELALAVALASLARQAYQLATGR